MQCDQVKGPDDFYWNKHHREPRCKTCRKALNTEAKRKRYNRSVISFDCLFCGRRVSRTVGDRGRCRFCSRSCKDKQRKADLKATTLAAKPMDRRCVWCGSTLAQSMRSDAMFCSADCNSKAHRTMRNWRRRQGKNAPLRPRHDPLPSFIDIAERDGWRCGICRKPVNRRLNWPDLKAGSLDHIVPLATGGTSTVVNLQLSHLGCNLSKRADPHDDQLRLIG